MLIMWMQPSYLSARAIVIAQAVCLSGSCETFKLAQDHVPYEQDDSWKLRGNLNMTVHSIPSYKIKKKKIELYQKLYLLWIDMSMFLKNMASFSLVMPFERDRRHIAITFPCVDAYVRRPSDSFQIA